MHHIFVKDQHLYDESLFFIANNHILFGPGLFAMKGEQHRKQRKMLNPVFSVAHLRHMVPTFFKVSEQLSDTFSQKVGNQKQEMDMVTWMTRAALEIVGQSGMGTSFGPVTEEQEEPHYIASYKLGGAWLQRKIVDIFPWKVGHQMADIVDTVHNTSVDIFEEKKKVLAQGDTEEASQLNEGRDIIGILMRENQKAANEDKLCDAEIIAQMSVLIFAAMDTTSSALARILHLLSMHQDVQDKLRAELREARENYGDQPDYDQLISLPYLGAVCRETLRLYPPVPTVIRETQADAFLPLSTPITGVNGEEMSEIFLPKDSKIFISIQASNTDPTTWGSDSYEWKPERWLSPIPEAVQESRIPGVYSNLMTFIGGGRSCIGFKFSQLEMKVIMFSLLNRFKFSLPKEEIFWQMTIIASPTVDPTLSELRPRMPLSVSRLED
ncbi:cytochrome P450 [Ephemerocybe angulata]|uniref:Cytochrome P450 n=1 Tax=Ephemerocybe angulata TaxID=980116 RepID=A0A8H6IEC3_9AGAR|nr:cytochrome P450 [Tulosesus angulatus]